MGDSTAVKVSHRPQNLRDNDLDMLFRQGLLRLDDLVQICSKIRQHQVNVFEVWRRNSRKIQDVKEVLMAKTRKEPDLAKHAFAVPCGLLHVFDRHLITTSLILT
mmetsp:Transcript_54963/g.128266  ORF Transcript_54963/g.128266 Transcript_54963/m.128266 type:complete len:105 (-) Transcript_54963:154-468(-)